MEYEEDMIKLIKTYTRTFYDITHIIVMDTLLTRLIMFDNELCDALRVLPKEFSKIIYRLREDKLIKQETKINTKENNYQELKQVYYVNYGEVKDVIKYKIVKMKNLVEAEMGRMEEIFICTTCKKEFNVLEAQSLMVDFLFKCDECGGILEENRRVVEKDPQNKLGLLNATTSEIVGLLRKLEDFSIPSIDYFQALEMRRKKEGIKTVENKIVVEEKVVVVEEKKTKIDERKDIYFEEIKVVEKEEVKAESRKIMISVGGIMKNINELTETDKEKMTDDEYAAYFEMCGKN